MSLVFRKFRNLLVPFLLLFVFVMIAKSQTVGIKTNILSLATTSLNLGSEFVIDNTYTANVNLSYNPWTFSDNKKIKHILIQPELRKWFLLPFMGPFVGIEAHYSAFNVGGISPISTLKNNRYQGSLIGVGVTSGYQWMLNTYFNIEVYTGLGYSYIDYKKYGVSKGSARTDQSSYNYFGPTQLGVSLIYFIK